MIVTNSLTKVFRGLDGQVLGVLRASMVSEPCSMLTHWQPLHLVSSS